MCSTTKAFAVGHFVSTFACNLDIYIEFPTPWGLIQASALWSWILNFLILLFHLEISFTKLSS